MKKSKLDQHLWANKYRPSTVETCILPQIVKDKANGAIANGSTHLLLSGPAGTGKAQPLWSKVLLRDGKFKNIGDVQIGDSLASIDGKDNKITGIFDRGVMDVFKVETADGRTTFASGDHLWNVNGQVRTTTQVDEIINKSTGHTRALLPKYVGEFGCNGVDINPYILGVLIGDGSLKDTSVRLSNGDPEIIELMNDMLIGTGMQFESRGDINYTLIDDSVVNLGHRRGMSKNRMFDQMDKLGLMGKLSHEKFLPDAVFSAPLEFRLELLRGLMDTDGTCDKRGTSSYCTTSQELAMGVQKLIWSIGGYSKITTKLNNRYTYLGESKLGRVAYIITVSLDSDINPFNLSRKADRVNVGGFRRRIGITKITKHSTESVRCISVSHDSSLYITDDYIVTHNTTLALAICEQIGADYIMYDGSSGELNIEELREGVKEFAQTRAIDGGEQPKYVIIDEIDGLRGDIQKALRRPMEKYKSVRFIFTCNYPDRVIGALHSRCSRIHYEFSKEEETLLFQNFARRCYEILQTENVQVDSIDPLVGLVKQHFPDNRRILNELQSYANSYGKIDAGILDQVIESWGTIFDAMLAKDFNKCNEWVANNSVESFFNTAFKEAQKRLPSDLFPHFVMAMGDEQKYHSIVPDRGLNVMFAMTKFMASIP